MNATIILSDDVHLHQRNFPSLFSVLSQTPGVQTKTLTSGRDLWNRYGDYSGVQLIEDRAEQLSILSLSQLREFTCRAKGVTVNAFQIARSEILSFVLAVCPNWYNQSVPNDDEFIFDKLYHENPAILRMNLAAVAVWSEIYSSELDKLSAVNSMIIFSGSQIYQKLLVSICSASRPRAFVVEMFQTGTEFYFEERYSPITAGSDIRFKAVRESLALPSSPVDRHNEINKAQNKLLNAQNKNVKQPSTADIPIFSEARRTVLIACQVQNDFSLIEGGLADVNPLSNYKELLDEMIEHSEFNIIVKTHPWEKHKTHLRTSFTKNNLEEYVATKPIAYQSRVAFCEDANLSKLLDAVDAFATVVSQASFEACFYGGLKPYLLGKPFYSGLGFTSEHGNARELATAMNANATHSLSLLEYSLFLEFTTKLLQLHLASVHNSGMATIRSRLFPASAVEVAISVPSTLKPTAKIATNNPAAMVLPTKVVKLPIYRRPLVPIARPFVKLIGNKPDDAARFTADPVGYFAKLKNPVYRRIGRVLFGA